MRSWLFFILIPLYACSPSSLEDYQREGEALTRSLIQELQQIETPEQLIKSEQSLKKHFEAYVALMIQAKDYQKKHSEEIAPEMSSDCAVSGQLKEELRRIYAMEGGRELVERAQQEALVRLDAYERGQTFQELRK